jgi:hypothetical protein
MPGLHILHASSLVGVFKGGDQLIDQGDQQNTAEKSQGGKQIALGWADGPNQGIAGLDEYLVRKRVLVLLAKKAKALPIPVESPANTVRPKANRTALDS